MGVYFEEEVQRRYPISHVKANELGRLLAADERQPAPVG
jgi:hypothetical protein